MEWRLCEAGDMSDDTLEDLRLVGRRSTHVGIEVLQLDLLPPEVLAEAAESAGLIFLPGFIVE